jgi:hypothetical protein
MTKKTNYFIIDTNAAINDGTLQYFLEDLLPFMKQLGLTIASRPYVGYGVEDVEVGELISIGTSAQFNVDVIARRGYAREQGYSPILCIVNDFNEIKRRLIAYSLGANQQTQELHCGGDVTFHRGFIKVDSDQGSVIIKNEEIGEIYKTAALRRIFQG